MSIKGMMRIQEATERLGFKPSLGKRIHVTHMNGQYEIVRVHKYGVEITCSRWERYNHQENKPTTEFVNFEDIKCLVGYPYTSDKSKAYHKPVIGFHNQEGIDRYTEWLKNIDERFGHKYI